MRNALFLLAIAAGQLWAAKPTEIKWATLAKYDLVGKKPGKEVGRILDKPVFIIGFMIPLDFAKKSVKEFLLVPYFPTCIHVPPPPENQVVMVMAKKSIAASYYPVRVEGRLRLAKEKKGNAMVSGGVYEMALESLKEIK